jgi:putative FmdB family regulatory protein
LPLYEYACKKCGRHVEKIQKFSDPPLTKCENCGGELERLLSSPAIQFKGAGWYVTDYARKSKGEATSSADSAPSTGKNEKNDKESPKPSEPAKTAPNKG